MANSTGIPREPTKGKSPFFPGQPVPAEFFVGRKQQIDRILTRGIGQVTAGKSVSIFVQGEYGIGKSSIASYCMRVAERDNKLLGIFATLGGARDLDDMAASVMEATARSGAFNPRIGEKIRNLMASYIGEQSIFGVTLHVEKLKQDAPKIASPGGMLPFLKAALSKVKEDGYGGIFLILDEINGITRNPQFAHFIKGLVETDALSKDPVPMLLMLCGVEERRRDMIRTHQPIDRIFDVVEIAPLGLDEMEEYFKRAYESVKMTISQEALNKITHYSAGFPKIMHLVGDAAYWIDRDDDVDDADATMAVLEAAEEFGKKFVDQQVYAALRTKEYKSILSKLGKMGLDEMKFHVKDLEKGLSKDERSKLSNFLQRMKRLNIIRPGEAKGEWVFIIRMVRLYIWMQSYAASQRTA